MRTPSWESSAGALVALLNSSTQVHMADVYTLTLSGGTVLRYSGSDTPVTIPGTTWSLGPVIRRGNTRRRVGVTVDSLSLSLAADATVQVNSVALLPFIAAGGFDGARVVLERAFAAAAGSPWVGLLPLFQGRVSAVPSASRYEASFTVASDGELLDTMIPRNVYQPGCGNTLFDTACGLAKASYAVATTATGATDAARTTFNTALAQATSYFAQGWAVGVTGPNAGVGRTIKAFAAGAITTIQPWPVAVGIGDTFTVYPGCDKLQATCSAKFANLARFRGHPYVPAPETIL